MNEEDRDVIAPPSWEVQEANRLQRDWRDPDEDRDRFGDTAAALASDSFNAAKERFMKAGSREGVAGMMPESDNRLMTAYQSAVGYFADMGLAGLDLTDAAFKAAVGTVAEAIPGADAQEEMRFARDAASIPDAFAGSPTSLGRVNTSLDDVLMGARKANADLAATYDPNQANIFLGMKSKGANPSKLAKATMMEQDGVDRKKIWEDTGWFKFNGEWLYEIDDSASEIALTAKKKGLDKQVIGGETVTKTVSVPASKKDELRVQNEFQQKAREVRDLIRRGEMSDADGQSLLRSLQFDLDERLANLSGTKTITTQGGGKPHPAANLKVRGKLDEVLYHPSLRQNADLPDDVSAEAGRQKSPGSYQGVYYPQGASEAWLRDKNISRVNAFKDAGDEDGIWSTFLHETQHLVDDFGRSSMTGSNTDMAKDLKGKLQGRINIQLLQLRKAPEFQAVREEFISRLGKSVPAQEFSRALTRIAEGDQAGAVKELLGKKTANTEDYHRAFRSMTNEGRFDEALPPFKQLAETKAYRIASMDSDWLVYAHEGGEVKARMVQARRKMTPEQRKARAPWETLEGDGYTLEKNVYSRAEFDKGYADEGPRFDEDDLENAN